LTGKSGLAPVLERPPIEVDVTVKEPPYIS